MGKPFHFKKKERKRLPRFAAKAMVEADKFETEGTKPSAVTALRSLGESVIERAKRRKKKHTDSK